MMAANPKYQPRMSVEEYLAFERASDTKHEYWQGEIIDMAGASLRHNVITQNTARHLGNELEDRPCVIMTSDMRVRVQPRKYAYPDVIVVCGVPQLADDRSLDTLLNPTVVIEVLSPSTEARDRSDKLLAYRTLESVQEIVLIEQYRPHIEVYTRQMTGRWLLLEAVTLETTLPLTSIDATLPLQRVYRGVTFDEPGAE